MNQIYAEIKREELKLSGASPPYQKPEVFALAYALAHIGDCLLEIAKSIDKKWTRSDSESISKAD